MAGMAGGGGGGGGAPTGAAVIGGPGGGGGGAAEGAAPKPLGCRVTGGDWCWIATACPLPTEEISASSLALS